MANFCTYCGKPLTEGAKFCTACGKPIAAAVPRNNAEKAEPIPHREPTAQKAQPTRNTQPTQPAQKQPVQKEQPAQKSAQTPKKNASGKKQGVFGMLAAELSELLKHPKKLIPTIVLAVIWIVLPLVMGFASGANIPVVRFISTLTYANGGVFGGFFGTVGGIFGKAVFAAVVNGLVLSICEKKNPFAGFKKSMVGVIGGGTKAVAPFLVGGGVGFLLYFFFNLTSAPQNSAIAIVCVISAVQTIARQNGVVFGLAFWAAKKLSHGKAPTRMFLNRVLSGLAAAFAVSFPITFLRVRFLAPLLGILLIIAGIVLPLLFAAAEKKASQPKPGVN